MGRSMQLVDALSVLVTQGSFPGAPPTPSMRQTGSSREQRQTEQHPTILPLPSICAPSLPAGERFPPVQTPCIRAHSLQNEHGLLTCITCSSSSN